MSKKREHMTSKILIGNISSDTTEIALREMLVETVGEVVHIELPKDIKTRKIRGYAIVELPSTIATDRAVDILDGYLLNGRALTISIEGSGAPRKWYEFGKD